MKPNKLVMEYLKKANEFYFEHQSIILTGGTIGFSLATTFTTMKYSRDVLNILDEAKEMLSKEENADKKKDIYGATIKEIAPKLLPIIIFQTATILCAIQNKKIYDVQEKKLTDAMSALSLAQNAIIQYQTFQKTAEEQLGEKKLDKINKEVAQERINNNPPTESNTVIQQSANSMYYYYDVFGNRYFWSTKAPGEIEKFCLELSKDLYDGNCDDDRVSVNDIYRFIDKSLIIDYSKEWGWLAEDGRGMKDSDLVNVRITPAECPDHKTLCYELDMDPRPLFRTRY